MKKGTLTTVLLIVVLVVGLSLLIYPKFSDYWNKSVQSKAVASYIDSIEDMDEDKYAEIWNSAIDYNKKLLERPNQYKLTEELAKRYMNELSISDGGMMGYIEIPKIEVYLPIYHTTNENVLQVAIGHIDWTSLPTGGASTHTVLSSHRGLPSAKLFTDLDRMQVGDVFMLWIMDECLTYEVDQILIVEPDESEALQVEKGKDLCTLVTCTPYGINSHRLLVRGHRIDNIEASEVVRVTADAMVIDKLVVVPFVLVPILLCMFVALLVSTGKKKNRRNVK
ncbi:MAG: class C sortase [Clostridia bacterium]|nr:class C sortase [Clostridia bacterium]